MSIVSHVHRKKPKGRPLPEPTRRANKSKIRAHVEHVFAAQNDRMALVIRTIGIARARVSMANLVTTFKRLRVLRRTATACGTARRPAAIAAAPGRKNHASSGGNPLPANQRAATAASIEVSKFVLDNIARLEFIELPGIVVLVHKVLNP
jgi:hypothetical protein